MNILYKIHHSCFPTQKMPLQALLHKYFIRALPNTKPTITKLTKANIKLSKAKSFASLLHHFGCKYAVKTGNILWC